MSNLIVNELNTLQRKLTLLLAEHNKVKEALDRMNQENKDLKRLVAQKEEKIESFQNNHKITKLANNLKVKETDNPELKQLLNQYIQEIDNCIVQLGDY